MKYFELHARVKDILCVGTDNTGIITDYSGSMGGRYSSGEVQDHCEHGLGLSLTGLDDDGVVPIFFFDDVSYEPVDATIENYQGIVDRWRYQEQETVGRKGFFKKAVSKVTRQLRDFGGTYYAPAIESVVQYHRENGGLGPDQPPVLVLFYTDGMTAGSDHVQNLLRQYSDLPIFWLFVGMGDNQSFLDVLDDMPGRVLDNVDKVDIDDVKRKGGDDVAYYDALLGSEFLQSWLPAARAYGIVR